MTAVERSDLPKGQQSKELIDDEPLAQAADDAYSRAFDFGASHADAMDVAVKVVEARVRAEVAEDLRPVVEKAIREWALLYPIPANGLARGAEERLAERWADGATRMVFEALAEHAGKAFPSPAGRLDRVWWLHRCVPGNPALTWFSHLLPADAPRPERCPSCGEAASDDQWLQLAPVCLPKE
jgi:hypothetical protein